MSADSPKRPPRVNHRPARLKDEHVTVRIRVPRGGESCGDIQRSDSVARLPTDIRELPARVYRRATHSQGVDDGRKPAARVRVPRGGEPRGGIQGSDRASRLPTDGGEATAHIDR